MFEILVRASSSLRLRIVVEDLLLFFFYISILISDVVRSETMLLCSAAPTDLTTAHSGPSLHCRQARWRSRLPAILASRSTQCGIP